MPRAPVPLLITPGIIARDIGQTLARVTYVLRTRSHIQPSARAGTIRLYDRKAVAQVQRELDAIDARHTGWDSGVPRD